MTGDVDEGAQRGLLRTAMEHAQLTVDELWLRYFAIGGTAARMELEAYFEGLMQLPSIDRDMLAIVVNERLDEVSWPHRVPYASSVREPLPATGPLAALVDLLQHSRCAPSELLPAVAVNAARALGLQVVMYLVDYDQRRLVTAAAGRVDAASLAVDGTVAGRAFRQVETIAAEAGGEPVLWVPLLDDVERLGVLQVTFEKPGDVHDPTLREQCRWLANLLAHLITLTVRYGDRLEAYRRGRRRTPAAELIWTLVPPTTAAVPGFTLAAAIEPSDQAGGDAYDYALSSTTADLALFDAMGHGINAALVAATALAGSRAARRDGRGLYERARLLDELISDQFGRATFATGVLASLDLSSGVLRYLSAGHLNPLLVRNGKVVKRLDGGRRLPFGLGTPNATIAEEQLEPGDWLLLHTDGITEARDRHGEFFGDRRLADFLEREAAAHNPPPETVRRLVHAVLDHHDGQLNDDATIVLARWDPAAGDRG